METARWLILAGAIFEAIGVLLVASPFVKRGWDKLLTLLVSAYRGVRVRFGSAYRVVRARISSGARWINAHLPPRFRRPPVPLVLHPAPAVATFGIGRATISLRLGWNVEAPTGDQLDRIRANVERVYDEVQELPEKLTRAWRLDIDRLVPGIVEERTSRLNDRIDDVALFPAFRGFGVFALLLGIGLTLGGNWLAIT